MKIKLSHLAVWSSLLLIVPPQAFASKDDASRQIERGRYLVQTSGCNDCHTPGYAQADGKVAEGQWLIGSPVGFSGPWGTSYPSNLRLVVAQMSESQWMTFARQPMRPPMPWFNLQAMSDPDLAAIYRYVRALGAAGEPAPAALKPGEHIATPYFDFVPKNLPTSANQASR